MDCGEVKGVSQGLGARDWGLGGDKVGKGTAIMKGNGG